MKNTTQTEAVGTKSSCSVGKAKVKLVNFWRCRSRWNGELSCKNKHLKQNVLGIKSIFKGNGLDSFHYNEYLIQRECLFQEKFNFRRWCIYKGIFSCEVFEWSVVLG